MQNIISVLLQFVSLYYNNVYSKKLTVLLFKILIKNSQTFVDFEFIDETFYELCIHKRKSM